MSALFSVMFPIVVAAVAFVAGYSWGAALRELEATQAELARVEEQLERWRRSS